MITSKGLRWSGQAIGKGRPQPYVARQFSSLVHRGPIQSKPQLLSHGTFPRPRIPIAAGGILSLSNGSRFASTAPSPTPHPSPSIVSPTATPVDASPTSASSTFAPDQATPSDGLSDLSLESLYDIPESIGYLKALGLDYGYGITATMEWLLEHIHVYAGTPWWVSIGLTAAVVRLVFYKAYLGAADTAARVQTVNPIILPLKAQMTTAAQMGDRQKAMEIRNEVNQIYARAGIKIWRTFTPMLQMVTGYGTFVLLRGMAKLPVPGFETGGALWFQDLTVADPIYVLPLAAAGVLHWTLKKGGEAGTVMNPEAQKLITYALPAISFAFTFWMPAAVQFSFFISGLLAGGQAHLFRQEWFRNYYNMTPLPKKPTAEAPAPLSKLQLRPQTRRSQGLSQAELNSRFQKPAQSGSLIDKLPLMGQVTEWVENKKRTQERRQKKEYEKKRQAEEQEKRKKRSSRKVTKL